MTVHMVRLLLEPPKGEADSAVDNWVSNHNEWTNDPVEHSLVETETPEGDSFVTGNYRFVQEESATELLDDLESRLSSFQGGLWYQIGYHECDHDEDSQTGCSWDRVREDGTIPDSIPTIEVN